MKVLSGQIPVKVGSKPKKPVVKVQDPADSIPPELLLRRDKSIRYERNGAVYATDGKVGVLKKVVVDEGAGEVAELIVAVDNGERLVLLPPDLVDKTAGSAVFLTINRVQFAERAASAVEYVKRHFARADVKALLKHEGRPASSNPRRAVADVGRDYVETPNPSPLDRLQRRSDAFAAD